MQVALSLCFQQSTRQTVCAVSPGQLDDYIIVSDGTAGRTRVACLCCAPLPSLAGVAAVLRGCPKLTTLQLQQCVGPFDVADMLAWQAAGALHQHNVQSSQEQQHRWQLSTLQLSGAATMSTDEQLLKLLSVPAAVQSGQRWSNLANLCLVRITGLSDGLLHALAAVGCNLQHLKLQECYASSAAVAAGSSSQPCPAAPAAAAFSEAAVLQLLQRCCHCSLKSLQLRHAAAPLSAGFVTVAVAAAPLLQLLVLDACDLPYNGAFDFEPSRHDALQAIHVRHAEFIRVLQHACNVQASHDEMVAAHSAGVVQQQLCHQIKHYAVIACTAVCYQGKGLLNW